VAQHIWANIVKSLAHSLPTSGTQRSQLDDLLAHVFSNVLIPEFEQNIQNGKNIEQRQRWIDSLRADPFNIFQFLGEGEQRQKNLDPVRQLTLRFLQVNHPGVNQTIARALITYCFVATERHKRILLTWLSGQDIDEEEAKAFRLPPSWAPVDQTSTDIGTQQKRERMALEAIFTLGILSQYYQPLILAFDQLERFRDEKRLTKKWADTLREIFNYAPNFLIVTCIFPSLWESWFRKELDQAISDRVAQQRISLDTFGPQHGLMMLATHLEASFRAHALPSNIFPFTEGDVTPLCSQAKSPRLFLQGARSMFQKWLNGDAADGVLPAR
jgi:hypothetical protein